MTLRDASLVFFAALIAALLAQPRRDPLDDFDAWMKRKLREGRRRTRDGAKG